MGTQGVRKLFVIFCYLVLVACDDSDTSVISRFAKSRKINDNVLVTTSRIVIGEVLSTTEVDDVSTTEGRELTTAEGSDVTTVGGDVSTTSEDVVTSSSSEGDASSASEGVVSSSTESVVSSTTASPESDVSTSTEASSETTTLDRSQVSVIRKHKSLKDNDIVKPRVDVIKDALFPLLETMIIAPISSQVEEKRCKNHSQIFRQELANFKLWAVQMVDASSKFPSGMLSGSTYQLGHFDECLGVSVELPQGRDTLRGQYCLAEIEFAPRNYLHAVDTATLWGPTDFNTSAWLKILGDRTDRRLRRRDVLHWAVCIPESCSAADLSMSMAQALSRLSDVIDVDISVRVNEALCQVDQGLFARITIGDIVMASIIMVFVLMVGAGTLYDIVRPKNHHSRSLRPGKLLQCFSAKTSLVNWARVDPNRDMIPVHVVRFGSMIGILMGHHFIADASSPLLNAEFFEKTASNIFILPLLVIPALVVDSFFLVSGFLTTRFLLLDLDRKKLKVFAGYMHRFLRLTPVYMLMVGFHATLLNKIGSGPLWPTRLARDQYRCSKNWWTNLLYINNYVNTDELCLFQSWHVACDLHFSLLAPILVMCLWNRPRSGLTLIAFLAAAIITALYVITWMWDLDPILMSFINVMTDLSADPTFRLQYIPTHTRGLPYLFGIVAAYLHYKNPFSKKQLSQAVVLMLWGVTVILMTSPIMAALIFYSPDYSPASWMSPMYAALHRIPWCIGQAWVIVAGITGNAGFLQKPLDFKLLVPLSRLSYCVFLVHNAVQLFMAASVRSPHHMGVPTILWSLVGDIVVTYSIALVVHLLFEAPIQRLDKTFFTKADNKSKTPATLPSTSPVATSKDNGWRHNLGYEKGSDEIATICRPGNGASSSVATS